MLCFSRVAFEEISEVLQVIKSAGVREDWFQMVQVVPLGSPNAMYPVQTLDIFQFFITTLALQVSLSYQ